MARRHARPQSPYIGYNSWTTSNINHPYAPPLYYQQPPAPLSIYAQLPVPAFPATPYGAAYSYSPSPNPPTAFYGNRAPLPEEMIALQNTLQMKEATISFLDAQIEAAKDNLDTLAVPYFDLRARFESAQSAYLAAKENHEDLLLQRAQLESSMQSLNALLHPIRRFPDVILTRVFMFAVEAEIEKDYDRVEMPRFKRPQVIINISRVCAKWRAAAFSKPELWTYIRLNLSRRSPVHDKLQHFLNLADGLPMNVSTSNLQPSFFGNSTDSEDDDNGHGPTALLTPVKKIRSLTVNYTHYRALGYLPALGTKCLDTLEELHLRSEPLSSPASGLFSIASYLAEAPNLRVLRLMHVHLLPPAAHEPSPSLQLPRVHELVMHGPVTHGTEIFGFSQVISMLPNVEKITFCQNDSVPFIVTDDIHLPRLRELLTNCVALDNALRTSFGIEKIIAPKLEKLTVMDQMNLAGGSTGLNANVPGVGLSGGSITSGLTLFLEKVKSIRELTIVGNFDPLTNAPAFGSGQPLLLQPPGMGLFGGPNMPPPIPIPGGPPGMLGGGWGNINANLPPPPIPTTTISSESFLKSMGDIERLEVQSISPRFVEALASIQTGFEGAQEEKTRVYRAAIQPLEDIPEEEEQEEQGDDQGASPSWSPIRLPSPSPSASPVSDFISAKREPVEGTKKLKAKCSRTFAYLPALQRLEITISKTITITPEDFKMLFDARCYVESSETAQDKVVEMEDEKIDDATRPAARSAMMRPLEKFEVHLGAGVEDALTDAVSERMVLDGEEKDCRWFSWTHPASAKNDGKR